MAQPVMPAPTMAMSKLSAMVPTPITCRRSVDYGCLRRCVAGVVDKASTAMLRLSLFFATSNRSNAPNTPPTVQGRALGDAIAVGWAAGEDCMAIMG